MGPGARRELQRPACGSGGACRSRQRDQQRASPSRHTVTASTRTLWRATDCAL